jgi:predicted nucleic acid-binding protein
VVRFLLDTNVLSEPARPAPDGNVVGWLKAQSALQLAISVLTLGEIRKSVALLTRGKRRDRLAKWVEEDLPLQFGDRLLSVDNAVAHEWGRLSAEGQRRGRPLPVVDGLLVATAAAHGLTFATRNEADCSGRGVPVYNPWTGAMHPRSS